MAELGGSTASTPAGSVAGQRLQGEGVREGGSEAGSERVSGSVARLPESWASSRRELGDEAVWSISSAKPGE
jgi:hypothetical protein